MADSGNAALPRFFAGSGYDDDRRRMVSFAALAPARVVFSTAPVTGPPSCTPDEAPQEEEPVPRNLVPDAQTGRSAYVVVHHTGKGGTDLDTTTDFCSSGYDFFIRSDGEIVVCSRWSDPMGRHAKGCNCVATGVMLTGCFGGCPSGDVERPTEHQECSLAHVLLQLGTPGEDRRIVPHRYCAHWNPCDNPAPTRTVCCGTNLTTDETELRWNAEGEAFLARVLQKRRNLESLRCCSPPCPELVVTGDRDGFVDRGAVLDSWQDVGRGVAISLHPLAAPSMGRGCVAEMRDTAGRLIARRWFTPSPAGIVATDDADVDGDLGLAAPPGASRRRWRVPLAAGVVVSGLAVVAALSATRDASRSPAREATSPVPVAEPAPPPPVRCDRPSFGPRRLPWSEQVGPPTSASARDDGSFELTWTGPPLSGWQAPQDVSVIRRVRPERAEVTSATASARGHPAQVMLVGDEGVGSIRAFWQEGDGPCQSFELNVSHGATIDEVVALLPRQ